MIDKEVLDQIRAIIPVAEVALAPYDAKYPMPATGFINMMMHPKMVRRLLDEIDELKKTP